MSPVILTHVGSLTFQNIHCTTVQLKKLYDILSEFCTSTSKTHFYELHSEVRVISCTKIVQENTVYLQLLYYTVIIIHLFIYDPSGVSTCWNTSQCNFEIYMISTDVKHDSWSMSFFLFFYLLLCNMHYQINHHAYYAIKVCILYKMLTILCSKPSVQ